MEEQGRMFCPCRFCGALQPKSLTGKCVGQLGLPLAVDFSVLGPSECGRRVFSF